MRKKDNQQNLKEAIDRLLKAYNLSDKMLQYDLIEQWELVMGKMVAKRTREIYFKSKVLYVHLDSSVLREELSMAKSKMIELLNEKMGKKVIEDIVLK